MVLEAGKKQLTKLSASHEIEIEQMTNDQRISIENIGQSILLEFAVIQENGSYFRYVTLCPQSFGTLLLNSAKGHVRFAKTFFSLSTATYIKISIIGKNRTRNIDAKDRKDRKLSIDISIISSVVEIPITAPENVKNKKGYLGYCRRASNY